jgi:asparagine synthase (glutamine-hydrolysing)
MSGITPNYIWPSPDDGIAAFWQTLEAQDAPFPGLSIVAQYLVFQAAHAQGMKVLLGGQGADEVLMGYRKFQVMLLVDALRRRDARAALRFGLSAGLMLVAEARTASVYLRQRQRYLSPRGLSTQLRLPPAELDLAYDASEPVWRRQVRDVKRLSLPTLLRYEDRNSMGNSLETRLPFLDYRFVELALALPNRVKVGSGYGKHVLRGAMRGRVPARIRGARYKRGFDTPQRTWLRAGLGPSIRDGLYSNMDSVSRWLPPDHDVEQTYSDDQLARNPSALGEATSLLWLAARS